MKNLIICFLITLSSSASIAQIVIVDELKNPIPYVDITTSNSNVILLQTNINGELPWKKIQNIGKDNTLILHRIAFKKHFVRINDLKNGDTIQMNRQAVNIPEVTISAKSPKFQKIKACYRSIKIQDDKPAYYTDGTINYLTKTKKLKYQLLQKEFRVYQNSNIDQFYNHFKVGITMGLAYIPIPDSRYLPYQFVKKHDLIINTIDSNTILILSKDSTQIGEIKKRLNFTEYSLTNIFDIKSRKALETEVNITDSKILMFFKNNKQDTLSLIDNFNRLIYFKRMYKYSLKHDKEKVKRNIETIEEIFVEDVEFLNEVDEEYTKNQGMPRESKYNSEFWKNCKCKFYYPPNESILDSMNLRLNKINHTSGLLY